MIYSEFINRTPDSKISFVCAAAGIHLAQLLVVPGASKHISAIMLPYDESITKEMLSCLTDPVVPEKMVSLEVAKGLARCGMEIGNCGISVGITGALQTNRDRRSDDQVFISILYENGTYLNYHGKFPKMSVKDNPSKSIDSYRSIQDEDIAVFVLNTLMHRSHPSAMGEYRRIL